MNHVLSLGLAKRGIEIIYPLIDKGKKEIISLGKELKVPFELTWSCYSGKKFPCGKCDSCRYRIKAFQDLGLKDPLFNKVHHSPRKKHKIGKK